MKPENIPIKTLRKKVNKAITEFLKFFEKNPQVFKSESDIKCQLYHYLIKEVPYKVKSEFEEGPEYNELLITTEFSTHKKYKKGKKRKFSKKYDLVVLDPRHIQEKSVPLIAIEVKLNIKRSLKKSKPSRGVYKDLNKLNRKANKITEGYLIILNNTNFTEGFEKLYEQLEDYFDTSKKLGNCELNLLIRHIDYKTGKLSYKC